MKLRASLLALALITGCTTPTTQRSATHIVLASPRVAIAASWKATETEIATLEAKIAALFTDPDKRVANLADGFPPHPFNDYAVRYLCSGPLESKFILVQAVLKTSPAATTLLDSYTPVDAPAPTGPDSFTVAYNLKEAHIVELRFGR